MVERKTIGEMNGWWAAWFKVGQVIVPTTLAALIALNSWMVKSILLLEPSKPRYTKEMAERDHLLLMREVDGKLYLLPPDEWRKRIVGVEERVVRVESSLIKQIDNQAVIIKKLDELKSMP